MGYIIVPDTSIFAVNRGKRDNESSSIIYRDADGVLHSIDFETCADNYRAEHGNASGKCIGERKMDEHYLLLYTSGIKTKIVFEKLYVDNLIRHHLLTGARAARFHALYDLIHQTAYTTYDLS